MLTQSHKQDDVLLTFLFLHCPSIWLLKLIKQGLTCLLTHNYDCSVLASDLKSVSRIMRHRMNMLYVYFDDG